MSPTPPMPQMNDLAARVQDLPAELYNDIFDLVLTPETTSVTIDKEYKPPAQLQISRATREHFAAKYYEATFNYLDGEHDLFIKWLKSLAKQHSLSIRKVHQVRTSAEFFSETGAPGALLSAAVFLLSARTPDFLSLDVLLSTNVLIVKEGGMEEAVVENEFGRLMG